MRTMIVICALALLVVAIPGVATAGPEGFGRCVIVWQDAGSYEDPITHEEKFVSVPTYECYW